MVVLDTLLRNLKTMYRISFHRESRTTCGEIIAFSKLPYLTEQVDRCLAIHSDVQPSATKANDNLM